MINTKLVAIAQNIDTAKYVADIGCDHCWLAVYLLKNKRANFVYNIDINEQPIRQGIKNLEINNCLANTKNLINDGLKGINLDHELDYIVIAGMGSENIIKIIEGITTRFKYLILQTNNNLVKLKRYIANKFEVISETYIQDNNIIYPILKLSNSKPVKWSNEEIYIGNQDKIINQDLHYKYLQERYNKISKIVNFNDKYIDEFLILKKFLKLR